MRRPLVVGNWKMNTSREEATQLAAAVRARVAAVPVEVVLCPPFVWLEAVRRELEGATIRVGAQDVYWESNGAYTGAVSAEQLAELCEYVIVGHMERRRLFGETDQDVARKVAAAVRAGIVPILVVGEDADARGAGRTEEVVRGQLAATLPPPGSGPLVVAYEPAWAIGSGNPATPEQAQAVAGILRAQLADSGWDRETVPVLYGGSVGPETFGGFIAQPDLDGALVGRASLDPEAFSAMVETAAVTQF